ncbi:MAG TPA: hypothetical protein VKB12_11580 [Pyrinomonadaceae bacterium]|nr:hypothetical protein [Pyrinomonadaceae bacterium]
MNIYPDRAFLPEGVPHAPPLYHFRGFRSNYGDGAPGGRSYNHYVERVAGRIAESHAGISPAVFKDRQRA